MIGLDRFRDAIMHIGGRDDLDRAYKLLLREIEGRDRAWLSNINAVREDDLEALTWLRDRDAAAGAQRCRDCGCTDSFSCRVGCGWVEEDLCSCCARKTGFKPNPAGGYAVSDEVADELVKQGAVDLRVGPDGCTICGHVAGGHFDGCWAPKP